MSTWTMSHFGENVIARERSDRSNLLSQHNEIASPPSAARNDKCDIVEVLRVLFHIPNPYLNLSALLLQRLTFNVLRYKLVLSQQTGYLSDRKGKVRCPVPLTDSHMKLSAITLPSVL